MKKFGTSNGKPILMVDEDLLTIDIIAQVRRYLKHQENRLKPKQVI